MYGISNYYSIILADEKNIKPRRKFLIQTGALIGAGLTLPGIPGIISACANNATNPPQNLVFKYEIDISDYPALLIPDEIVRCNALQIGPESAMIQVIVRVMANNKFVIVQSNCSHQKDQKLPVHINKKGHIVCPRHRAEFSLNLNDTGKLVANPNNIDAKPLRVFEYEYKKDEQKIVLLISQ
jgi:nitrite reductase/ring-hydroxylating ferredoxin subunit